MTIRACDLGGTRLKIGAVCDGVPEENRRLPGFGNLC